jgi:hypothetical protein
VPPPLAIEGALPETPGRFNFNAQLGVPGADAACTANFTCTHACTLQELQALPASQLMGLKDTTAKPVTAFWAIDSTAPALQQCIDDTVGGSGLNWEYGTAHTPSRGEQAALAADGTLGAVQMNQFCISPNGWVGCCQ